MKRITEFTDQKLIKVVFFDFDGVFTDNSVIIDEEGKEYVKCSRYDGFGIAKLKSSGVNIAVITTERVQLAMHRCRKLGIECYHDIENKLEFGLRYLYINKLTAKDAVFVGNDINDYEFLKQVRCPIITADAHESVKNESFYQTSIPGGAGCVREICDHLTNT